MGGDAAGVDRGYISAVGLDGGYGVCLQNITVWSHHIYIDINHV